MLGLRVNRWGSGGSNVPGYYFAADGHDVNNTGLSPSSPFQTITKLNSLNLAGEINKVFLKKGDSFEGTIALPNSGTIFKPIIIGAYGTGDKPKIYGSQLVTGWTLHTGNIWKATFATGINQLFVAGNRMQAARFPATGYANVDAAPSTSSLTCAALNGALNYTGVKCHIHSSSYGLDMRTVTSSTGTTLQLNSAPFGDVSLNEKFILVGKLEFLTQPGQWFYDTDTSTVYLWKADSTQPTNTEVRGSTRDYGFNASGKSFFQVTGIGFEQQKTNGIYCSNCSNFNVNNISAKYPDAIGISDLNCTSGVYYKNYVVGANHLGIRTEGSTNSTIEQNEVYNIALFNNLGLSGIGAWYNGNGIATNGDGNLVTKNRVDEVGYNGISFNKINTVTYNYVTNFCRTKNDGGGIYTSATPNFQNEANKTSVVRYNTCLYGWGYGATPYAEGIYLDESSGGVTVEYNNVAYLTGRGIFSHIGNTHTIRYNHVFEAYVGILLNGDERNHLVSNNTVYCGLGQYICQKHFFHASAAPVVDNNTYINHFNASPFKVAESARNFTAWKSETSFDANSTCDNSALSAGYAAKFLTNPDGTVKTFYLNAATNVKNDVTQAALTGSFTVPAYGSMIVTGLNVDCILDYADITAPAITAFAIPETGTLTIAITTLTATGTATKYKLTESSTPPTLESSGWTTTPPAFYTFSSSGSKTLYAWARDAAGNISAYASDNTTVTVDLKQGLIACYDFEADGTSLVDAHTNALNGTNKNNTDTDRSVTKVSGNPGYGYPYISTGLKYSTIPANSALDFSGAFTASLWVNVTSLSVQRGLISKRGTTTNSEFSSWITTSGAIVFLIAENGDFSNRAVLTTANGIIATGTNYLIQLKSDGTDRKAGFSIWVNGTEQSVTYSYAGTVTSDLTAGIVRGTNPLIIGSDLYAASNMYGTISQAAIWNYKTGASEYSLLHNSGAGANYNTW